MNSRVVDSKGLKHDWNEIMKIASVMMPLFALVAGVVGFYLRILELWNIFDERTGLPERGAAVTIILIALSVALLLIVLAFSYITVKRHSSPEGFENAFGTEPLKYPVTFTIIGIIWLGATVKHFLDVNTAGGLPAAEIYFSVLSAMSAISIILFNIEVYQNPQRRTKLALSVVPVLFMCFWLILLYRQNASNPVLLSYSYSCLAIMFAALGLYYTCGFVFCKPAPGKTIFSSLAAIYFCFVTLADRHSFGIRLIFISLIAVNVVYSSMLIKNLRVREQNSEQGSSQEQSLTP